MFLPVRDIIHGNVTGVTDGSSVYSLDHIKFVTWLEEQEKTTEQWLDEHPHNPWGTLEQHKLAKIIELNKAINQAVRDLYNVPEERIETIQQLLARARTKYILDPQNTLLKDAVDYLEAFETWALIGWQSFFVHALTYIEAATTHEQVEAVSWADEMATWLATDPRCEVLVAAYKLAQGESTSGQ